MKSGKKVARFWKIEYNDFMMPGAKLCEWKYGTICLVSVYG
ncbi:MAG: hypothetical protein ACLVDZ_09180 [Ruminococcus sp.]